LHYELRPYVPDFGRWLVRDPIGERGGVNNYNFALNSLLNHFDYLGLEESATDEDLVTDGAGNKCCEDDLQEVSIKVDYRDNGGDTFGHAWVSTPNYQRGFYPGENCQCDGQAVFGTENGQVVDDSNRDKVDEEYVYKVCPATVSALDQSIQAIGEVDQDYAVFNDVWGQNCCGWACAQLENIGLTPPFDSDTVGLIPKYEYDPQYPSNYGTPDTYYGLGF
jgi:hypothetical protein